MKFATKRPLVLFLLVSVAVLTSCRQTDLGEGGIVVGKVLGGAAGWGITNEGKVIAAAFLDAHNKLVAQARALPAVQKGKPKSLISFLHWRSIYAG